MAIVVHFEVSGLDAATYDALMARLVAEGHGALDGRLHHMCYGDRQHLQVIDIWESPANFEAFGATLGPLLQSAGIQATPKPEPAHNIITA
jgi:hypothetical protein